jgi:Mlc titration factor MtfA (ptsG expression regulator)
MLSFLKERRRKQIRARPFPNEWRTVIKNNVAFFARLNVEDQAELLAHVQVFLSEKNFEGVELEITDEVRVTIAAQACLLLLHRKTDYFPRLLTILVYRSTYLADENRPITAEIWEEGKSHRAGETARQMGSMVLAWDAVKSGAADPSDGKNVVLHEFAHQLDYENFAADGTPALATRKQQLAWQQVMRTEFASLRAADQTGIPTLLDTYGATNAAEFFAVSVEAFFERPIMLRARHQRLYAQLQEYFQQDPVNFSAERARSGPSRTGV